ncbi:hypothetical protein A1Q1_01264 [Trichosporon asahii var. asahii CBS 2479]|uniref:Uncharacterized protein n=1 Tax=Trichosporon asahii var. asahii (strain ATCC 90039 / CBS 2479 / JCM 2466 / KCTC 7840 / NBRC 103889/ NCYC 2677 / UAMH 7654) TaxID=1186058 RepID=J4UEG6_TRIAS|nr:hypothetical protein A1Q1_01264 [Trichosporon asahii var. asahii CBS 2479]EJT49635.1 hypothetical protein A1Q1_01264 [Trichosporon asahii var. asahii CBS 2479]
MTDLQCFNLCQHHPPWAYGRPHSSKWAWPSPAPRSLLTTAPYLSEFDPGSEFDRPEPSNQSLAALGNQLTRQSEEPARQAETVSEAVVLDREQEIAKEALAKGDKTQLLSRTDEQLQTLQELVTTIEFTQIQATVVHGLEQGNSVLKQLQKEMSLERVEKLMDETRDGIEYQKEIDNELQSSMSAEDEEAVQRELEALQAEQMIPDVPETEPVHLPDAPVEEPAEPAQKAPAEAAKEERVALAA